MATTNAKKEIDFNVEIGLKDGQEWSTDKLAQTKKLIKDMAAKRSPERVLKNEFLAIQYKMEEYGAADEKSITKPILLETFLQEYLTALNISFRKFAIAIDINDANLKKYIAGDRKFNADIATRFGRFFHTSPITWMKVYQLNDLIKLRAEKIDKRYDKYDFTNVAQVPSLRNAATSVKRASVSVQKTVIEAPEVSTNRRK
jgi:plasmid maintenance system antidote protein VapI